MATARDYETYALMLQELGIDVSSSELLPDACDITPAPPERERDRTFDAPQMASFVQLSHVQPDRAYVPYKRMTHFIQHLSQVTGRNGHPDKLKPLVTRLKRAGVKHTDPMAYFRIRRLLKKWGYTSPAYRQIFSLLKMMGGQVLQLSYAYEMALRKDFDRLCRSFDEGGKLHGRKNFLSYYLVVQLLVDKYKIPCFYRLPSIKDSCKFRSLVGIYYGVTHAC